MSTTAGEILSDIRGVLTSAGLFAAVTIGHDADSAKWPRAEVVLAGVDEAPADDRPAGRWLTLKAKVFVHVQGGQLQEATGRALELAEAAAAALLQDRFRGGRCRDLPGGRATETGSLRLESGVRPPALAASFDVRCHWEC